MRNALIALVAALGLTASAVYFYPGVAILTAVKVRTFFADTQIAPARRLPGNKGLRNRPAHPLIAPPISY